jgi:hypothetical protein
MIQYSYIVMLNSNILILWSNLNSRSSNEHSNENMMYCMHLPLDVKYTRCRISDKCITLMSSFFAPSFSAGNYRRMFMVPGLQLFNSFSTIVILFSEGLLNSMSTILPWFLGYRYTYMLTKIIYSLITSHLITILEY